MRRRRVSDPVTPEVRAAVFARDGECLLHKVDPEHACRDAWGNPHSPYEVERCSVEHVKDQPRMGKRAPSDASHLVALCHAANVAVPSKAAREFFRAYLAAWRANVPVEMA